MPRSGRRRPAITITCAASERTPVIITTIISTATTTTTTTTARMGTTNTTEGPLFDAYLVVDWSASTVPKRGADSIWFCAFERGADRGCRQIAIENPATRGEAERRLGDLLADWRDRGRFVLAGFD